MKSGRVAFIKHERKAHPDVYHQRKVDRDLARERRKPQLRELQPDEEAVWRCPAPACTVGLPRQPPGESQWARPPWDSPARRKLFLEVRARHWADKHPKMTPAKFVGKVA